MARKVRIWGRWVNTGQTPKAGGQGQIFVVKDGEAPGDGLFALKELTNPKRQNRFERELQGITRLSGHPNVVELIDSGLYSDVTKPYYVMAIADGSLEELVPEIVNDLTKAFSLFEQVCSGVAHAHAHGVIHRDLKPDNILIFSGQARVADFGLCLLVDERRITPSLEAVGPRYYMAPELEDGRNLDVGFTADVYSLGKVLYYMLSGGRIFSREKYGQRGYRLSEIRNDQRLDIFNEVFRSTMADSPEARYKDASELLAGFSKVKEKFLQHPRTTLLGKCSDPSRAVENRQFAFLEQLTDAEVVELLK